MGVRTILILASCALLGMTSAALTKDRLPDKDYSVSLSCCGSLKLDSGGMGNFYQGDRLGNYRMTHTDSNGKPVYDQINGQNYLYWIGPYGPWMVGEQVGVDQGGILNRGSQACPEALTPDWEYWNTAFEQWDEDWTLEAVCEGGDDGHPPGGVEECTTGPTCNGCGITSTVNGVLYCCSVDCNSGWLEAGSVNGEHYCSCGH